MHVWGWVDEARGWVDAGWEAGKEFGLRMIGRMAKF